MSASMVRSRPGKPLWIAGGLGAIAISQWLGRTAGSTRAERHRLLPGDELVLHPTVITNHAITIPASPERIWPWLVQMGWHRGGWYTPRWVDQLLFPANWPSANRLIPQLQRPLRIGDRIPDGPPGTAKFLVQHVKAPQLLVLHSTTHVPASWRMLLGASIDWVWAFALDEQAAGTRLLLRTRARIRPKWLAATYVGGLVPADFLMASGMLNGIRHRVRRPRVAPVHPPPPTGAPPDAGPSALVALHGCCQAADEGQADSPC
jgi:hypothetical protein